MSNEINRHRDDLGACVVSVHPYAQGQAHISRTAINVANANGARDLQPGRDKSSSDAPLRCDHKA